MSIRFASALGGLIREGVVREYPGGSESVYAINPEKHQQAAFYRNASIHFFLNRAIVELALLHAAETVAPDPEEAVWQEALRLRDLLKFEFFFARKREYAEEMRAEATLMEPGWESRTIPAEDIEAVLMAQPMLLAPRVLRPFVEAYRVVAEQLAEGNPSAPLDEEEFVAGCIAHRPAAACPRADHGRRVHLGRALRGRAEARVEPRSDRSRVAARVRR